MKEFAFQWHITNYCNLRCKHCYQNDFTKKDDLDTEINKAIIKKISETLKDKKISINVTGGEPLLRKDIFEFLEFFEKIENIKEFNIITNAIPLNKASIEKLDNLGKLKQLKISLECSDSVMNDSIRGKGSFKKVMENFELLKKISLKEKVLMFTLGSYNYMKTLAMLCFSRAAGADALILERFVPQGQGEMLKEHYLKKDEWLGVIKNIINFANLNTSPANLLPYKAFYIELQNEEEVQGALCNLGDESMALMPNGDIYPCRRLPIKIGNVIKEDFGDILIRLKLLRESFNTNLKGKCKTCTISECIGCRALAYTLTGNLYGEDVQCYHEQLG